MKNLTEEEIYRFCLLTGRPYFGPHLHATQGQPRRHAYMHSLGRQEIARHRGGAFSILEIGSWAGGSAITWANALKMEKKDGRVFCVDPWRPYERHESFVQSATMVQMNRDMSAGGIFPLFLHNIRCNGHQDVVIPIQGESERVLPLLGREKFQIVYVDGDHRYSAVLSDLRHSIELVGQDGVLCGDDLELQMADIDLEVARSQLAEDWIQDPKTGNYYHPGVTLAVGETFERVGVWEGFWAVRKTSAGWQPVELPTRAEMTVPRHLQPSSVDLTLDLTIHLKNQGIF